MQEYALYIDTHGGEGGKSSGVLEEMQSGPGWAGQLVAAGLFVFLPVVTWGTLRAPFLPSPRAQRHGNPGFLGGVVAGPCRCRVFVFICAQLKVVLRAKCTRESIVYNSGYSEQHS